MPHHRQFSKHIVLGILIIVLAVLATSPVLAQEQVTHTVQAGENLFRIALRYGVSQEALAQANGIVDMTRIYAGQVLVIPGLSVPDASQEVVNPLVASTPIVHTVESGETLSSIAQKYGTTVEQLIQANNITNPNRILRGQQLNIWTVDNSADAAAVIPQQPAAAALEAASTENTIAYTVQAGEHLAQIAQRFGVSWPVVAQLNNITDPNRVYAGQQLLIPTTNGAGGASDLGILEAPRGPGATISVGKQIVIDLSDSSAYAYENGQLVYSALGSTGLPATPTVQGDFKVYRKVESQTMSGPGYYLPGVPWILYFYQGYSLHGTYWHNNFGQPMSHGCVNLRTDDALWFYNWAEIGTPVHVQA